MTQTEYEFLVIHRHLNELESNVTARISLLRNFVDNMMKEVLERQKVKK